MTNYTWKGESNSELVMQAKEIAEETARLVQSPGFTTTPYVAKGRTETLRGYVRELIRNEDWNKRVNTAVDGEVLFVHVKQLSRVDVLTQMLEKALPAIEDERVYDECMEILYGKEV